MKIFDGYTFEQNESAIRIIRSKKRLRNKFVLMTLLQILITVFVLSFSPSTLLEKHQLLLGIYLVPLITLPFWIKSMSSLIKGWALEFDKKSERILLNHQLISNFDGLEKMELSYDITQNAHTIHLIVQNKKPILLMKDDKRAVLENYGRQISIFIAIDFWYRDPGGSEMLRSKDDVSKVGLDYGNDKKN